jgi:hypothetical protein
MAKSMMIEVWVRGGDFVRLGGSLYGLPQAVIWIVGFK